MGAPIARNLIAAGFTTSVWDRTVSATATLAQAGARVGSSPALAVEGAQVVISMLPTAEITAAVMFDTQAVDALAADAIWVQMGTVGVAGTTELAKRLTQRRPDVRYVDAPVSGSQGPAESAQLLILASGPPEAQPVLASVFDAIGERTMWLGPAGTGSRMKLVINAYLSMLIQGVAEAVALAEHLGVEPSQFGDAIAGGALDAPIVDSKLRKIETGDFTAEFPLAWALKDVELAIDAVDGSPLPLLTELAAQWQAAVEVGHGRQDISAAIFTVRPDPEQS